MVVRDRFELKFGESASFASQVAAQAPASFQSLQLRNIFPDAKTDTR